MRTLTLLLFLSLSIAQGQEKVFIERISLSGVKYYEINPEYVFTDSDAVSMMLGSPNKDNLEVPMEDIFKDALLSLYSRYEKDCYADSTLTFGAIFRDWKTYEHYWAPYEADPEVSVMNYVRPEHRWTHREPTFPGFIQWLRSTNNGGKR